MPATTRLESIAAIAEHTHTSEDFSFAVRDFLDGFRQNPDTVKLAAEPRSLTKLLQDDGYADAYLAALTEHLATQLNRPAPAWCFNPGRSLKEPRFAYKTPEGRMFLLVESPTAFRVRNIFISADGLNRV